MLLLLLDASEEVSPEDIIEALKKLPQELLQLLKEILAVLVLMLYFVGAILVILGMIEWATSYNEIEGKRYIVKGFILVVLATLIMI